MNVESNDISERAVAGFAFPDRAFVNPILDTQEFGRSQRLANDGTPLFKPV
jgi:hypothetical protein